MSSKLRTTLSLGSGIPFAALYGILARVLFGAASRSEKDQLFTMTLSFLVVAPAIIGVITVLLASAERRAKVSFAIWGPMLSSTVVLLAMIALALEAAICVVMLSPIYYGLAVIGGVVTWAIARALHSRSNPPMAVISLIAILPFLSLLVEQTLPVETRTERVTTSIDVAAPAEVIWPLVIRVSTIAPAEHVDRAAYLFGIPRPVEATLTGDGPGALRMGRFDNGLIFEERVTTWQPNRRVAFSITPHAPSLYAPWDMIGKTYLNLVDAEYELQPIDTQHTRLFLHTRVNISTRFNDYSAWWVHSFTGDFLGDLLQIVKHRSEKAAGTLRTS